MPTYMLQYHTVSAQTAFNSMSYQLPNIASILEELSQGETATVIPYEIPRAETIVANSQ
jgi:hypothetical protein